MQRIFCVGLLVTLAASAFAQQEGRLRAGETPPQPLRGEIHGIADPMMLVLHSGTEMNPRVEEKRIRPFPTPRGSSATSLSVLASASFTAVSQLR